MATDFTAFVNIPAILQWIFYTFIFIVFASIAALVVYKMIDKKRYGEFKVIIIDKDSNGTVLMKPDTAGRFLKKRTQEYNLWLKKANAAMDPTNPPYVTTETPKGKIVKTIYVRKIGANSYVYVRMKVTEKGMEPALLDEDMNNYVHESKKIRNIYNKPGWWDTNKSLIMFMFGMVLTLILMMSLMQQFKVVGEASTNMVKVSEYQAHVADVFYNLTANPGLNQNIPIIVPTGGTT